MGQGTVTDFYPDSSSTKEPARFLGKVEKLSEDFIIIVLVITGIVSLFFGIGFYIYRRNKSISEDLVR